jgi:hypothetical protein
MADRVGTVTRTYERPKERRPHEVRLQLESSKLLPWIRSGGTMSPNGETLMGTLVNVRSFLITARAQTDETGDPIFLEGNFYGLHRNVDTKKDGGLTDLRSRTHSLGWGSLQMVIDTVEGTVYADVDADSPYDDLYRWTKHAGVVVKGFLTGRWWRA